MEFTVNVFGYASSVVGTVPLRVCCDADVLSDISG